MLNFTKKILKKVLLIFPVNTIDYFFYNRAKPLFNKKVILENSIDISLYSFGNINKNKIFYLIRRSPGAGLFSNVLYVMNHLAIAEKHGFEPYVEMQNFKTIYNEKKIINNTQNAWEYYFKQVSRNSIKEIYKSHKVILTDNRFYKTFKHSFTDIKLNKLAKKYLKIKEQFNIEANNFIKKNFTSNSKTLGIHYRGTSYKSSANHPFPPTKKQIIDKSKYLITKYKYDKIFLCTEEKEIFEALTKEFGNKICFIKESYRSNRDDAFKKYPRSKHRYKLGREILIESIILSKCHGLLYQNSNVSAFIKYLDYNKKIKYFYMKTALNSSNEYIAQWLWYYKNLVPKFMGGFE